MHGQCIIDSYCGPFIVSEVDTENVWTFDSCCRITTSTEFIDILFCDFKDGHFKSVLLIYNFKHIKDTNVTTNDVKHVMVLESEALWPQVLKFCVAAPENGYKIVRNPILRILAFEFLTCMGCC